MKTRLFTRRHASQATSLCRLALALGVLTSPVAAATSPSIDVLGSYFPAWLLCIVVGIVLTLLARLLFIAWRLDKHLLLAPITYPCLAAVFAMAVWLFFFRN